MLLKKINKSSSISGIINLKKEIEMSGIFKSGELSATSILWGLIQEKTEKDLKVGYCSQGEISHLFKSVLCPQKSACQVGGVYFHANHLAIELPVLLPHFVAAQAPLVKTASLFWRFIHEGNYSIVDLKGPKGSSSQTIDYPENKGIETGYSEGVVVQVVSEEDVFSTYQVTYEGISKEVRRFHFDEWPDHGVVKLLALHKIVQVIKKMGDQILVHCLAGVGRTGTAITAFMLEALAEKGLLKRETLDEQIMDIIVTLRCERGPSFVQTEGQLHLLRRYALWLTSWELLEMETRKVSISFLDEDQVVDRILCPALTACSVKGEYLNANKVQVSLCPYISPVIISQSPTDQTLPLFWKFVGQQGCYIIDLRGSNEVGDQDRACPSDLLIKASERDFTVSPPSQKGVYFRYLIKYRRGSVRINAYQHRTWGQGGIISLEELHRIVEMMKKFSAAGSVLVHSLSGTGRSAVATIAYFLEALSAWVDFNEESLDELLKKVILEVRAQRGPSCVETKEQFNLLRDYGLWLIDYRNKEKAWEVFV